MDSYSKIYQETLEVKKKVEKEKDIDVIRKTLAERLFTIKRNSIFKDKDEVVAILYALEIIDKHAKDKKNKIEKLDKDLLELAEKMAKE